MARKTLRPASRAIQRAIAHLGSQQALAAKLGVRQSAVSKWLYGSIAMTAERAVQIEEATDGAVRREDLRPDLFRRSAA